MTRDVFIEALIQGVITKRIDVPALFMIIGLMPETCCKVSSSSHQI